MKASSHFLPVAWHCRLMPLLVAAVWTAVLDQPGHAEEVLRYRVRIWQDGLPQNSVFAISQTPDGYLWVGTHAGLARFDGLRFTLLDDPAAGHLKAGWV